MLPGLFIDVHFHISCIFCFFEGQNAWLDYFTPGYGEKPRFLEWFFDANKFILSISYNPEEIVCE